jgi:hypothetical protein
LLVGTEVTKPLLGAGLRNVEDVGEGIATLEEHLHHGTRADDSRPLERSELVCPARALRKAGVVGSATVGWRGQMVPSAGRRAASVFLKKQSQWRRMFTAFEKQDGVVGHDLGKGLEERLRVSEILGELP